MVPASTEDYGTDTEWEELMSEVNDQNRDEAVCINI